MGKAKKPTGINNKRNFELALIITAIAIGVVGALVYQNNPLVLHQLPLPKILP